VELSSLKKSKLEDARELALPVVSAGELIGRLVPVGDWILGDETTIQTISEWRARFMRMFLAQFKSTPEKTEEYLRICSLGQDDRLLYMVEVKDQFVGHIGIANCTPQDAELDNLMRGGKSGPPDLMIESERTLINWCFRVLKLESIYLRILSYNFPAATLHESIGFVVQQTSPLKREGDAQFSQLIECEASDANVNFTCDLMRLERERFEKLLQT
jgi:RimJ/RimL family protein N-acetyltransferase